MPFRKILWGRACVEIRNGAEVEESNEREKGGGKGARRISTLIDEKQHEKESIYFNRTEKVYRPGERSGDGAKTWPAKKRTNALINAFCKLRGKET